MSLLLVSPIGTLSILTAPWEAGERAIRWYFLRKKCTNWRSSCVGGVIALAPKKIVGSVAGRVQPPDSNSHASDATPEGRQLLASAKQILVNLGKKDATAVSLADASDANKIFTNTVLNGDGVIIPETAECQSRARKKNHRRFAQDLSRRALRVEFSNPLELLIATILSAQCTDKRVNIVTAELFKKYRSAADYANAPLAELEQAIKTTGFFRNKAKNIQACCRKLVEKHGGQVPRTMEELTQLDGVGRKTANVVLGNAFGINVGVVVDTHVTRLANRLGLTKQTDAGKNRAGVDATRAAATMDAVQPLAHLARTAPLLRAQAGLCRLRNRQAVSSHRGKVEMADEPEHRTNKMRPQRRPTIAL